MECVKAEGKRYGVKKTWREARMDYVKEQLVIRRKLQRYPKGASLLIKSHMQDAKIF